MGVAAVSADVWLSRLADHLREERYQCHVVDRYGGVARRFLVYLEKRGARVEHAQPADVAGYVRSERQRFRRRHHHAPTSVTGWRNSHTAGVHMLLRVAQGAWPPPLPLMTERDRFQHTLIQQYAAWMQERYGLAAETRRDRCAEAHRFLAWLGPRGTDLQLQPVCVTDLDAYVTSRAPALRRVSRKGFTVNVRSFLRFLHAMGHTTRDLSLAVSGPRVYGDEEMPSALRAEDVTRVLQVTGDDQSAIGRRDYAVLILLARYGLRAGEVTILRLEDLDWQHDRVRVHHTKIGTFSELPLRSDVGDAIVDYLRNGRPPVTCREVFVRARAPYRPFRSGSSLYAVVRRRLEAAEITLPGKKGPHTFRHARAVSLLRASVPAKLIGDLLGHRSAESTTVYLKLATDDLRDVSLEIPLEVTR